MANLSEDVELVVSELATNAMLHAQTPFTVSLNAFEHTLLLEVEDGSPTVPVHVHADPLDAHGRGLDIVDLLSREWGMDPLPEGRKSIWVEFNLPWATGGQPIEPPPGVAVVAEVDLVPLRTAPAAHDVRVTVVVLTVLPAVDPDTAPQRLSGHASTIRPHQGLVHSP